jgi:coenzyme PQQ precursor peptide PqqA
VKPTLAAGGRRQKIMRRIAMQWEKPEFVEISLACEISSYANAELPGSEKGEALRGAQK